MTACIDLDRTGTAVQPGGDMVGERLVASVGRDSTSRVADVMTRHPLTLDPDLPVRAAAMVLFHRRIGGAPVVTASGELVGVFSEADVLDTEAAARSAPHGVDRGTGHLPSAPTVGDVCSWPAYVTRADASLSEVARELLDHRIGRLVVVDDGRVVGMVTRRDVLHALIRTDVELYPLVNCALAALGEPEVIATVTWGDVMLTGTATRRSRIPGIAAAIAAIDGIAGVRDELAWREDDIVPAALHTPRVTRCLMRRNQRWVSR